MVMATTNVSEEQKQNYFEEVQDWYCSLDKAGAKILLHSLAVTDLCAGLFSEPMYVNFVGDCSERTLEHLSLLSSHSFCNSHNFDFGVFVDTNCN